MQETQKACGGGLFSGSSPENDTSFSNLSPKTPKGFFFLSDCTFMKCLHNRGGDLLTKNSSSMYVGIQ